MNPPDMKETILNDKLDINVSISSYIAGLELPQIDLPISTKIPTSNLSELKNDNKLKLDKFMQVKRAFCPNTQSKSIHEDTTLSRSPVKRKLQQSQLNHAPRHSSLLES